MEIHGQEGRSRLSTLSGFADGAAPAGARRRLVIDTLDDPALAELPDVAHEIRTLRRVLEINRRLARQETTEELLEAVLDAAVALTGASRCHLVRSDGDGGFTVVRSRDPGGAPVADGDGAVAGCVVLRVLERKVSVVAEDFQRDAVRLGGTPDEAPDTRSIACVPFPDDLPAALYLDSRREEGLFSNLDADLLRAFAEQAALSLERVRLLEDNGRQRAELSEAGRRAEVLNQRLAELVEQRTVELRQAREDLALVDGEFRQRYTEIVGRGPAMTALLRQVDRVADTDVPVLYEGESGTGKELLARALHAGSRRARARFVAENCAALPETLLENELFGHERGAFTGAEGSAMGMFERADGGTLFLDEVGDMSAGLQKRLLRVLQEGEVRRIGASAVRKVDVRIVTATNRDLLSLVNDGRFREDLYYRLAVVKVRVPPLRERREDVPDLIRHFLERASRAGAREAPPAVVPEAMDLLVRYDWPGNVRQLENEMRRVLALSPGGVSPDSLSPEVREGRVRLPPELADPVAALGGRDLRALVEELEVRVLRAALAAEAGNITRTARALGLSRLGLRKKMQRYGLVKPGE